MTRRTRRALLVVVSLGLHHAAGYGLAAWDVGDRVLAGGMDRALGVALLLAFFALRFFSVVVLPALLAWWSVDWLWRRTLPWCGDLRGRADTPRVSR